MRLCLMRTTLLVYVGYIALLTELACNPTTDAPSRAIVVMALGLFILRVASNRFSPCYTAYLV